MSGHLDLIIVGIIGVIGLLVTLFTKKPAAPAPVGPSEVQKTAEKKTLQELKKAEEKHTKAVEEATKDHEEVNQDLIDTLDTNKRELLTDEDKLNEHLLDVGKQVRGG